MAAEEQHRQRVVLAGDLRGRWFLGGRQVLAAPPGLLAAPLVDQPAGGGLQQPAVRLRRDAGTGPVLGRGQQPVLDGVLGRVEVAVPAGERAEDLRRQPAQQVLDVGRDVQREPPTWSRNDSISVASDGASSMICRTWIGCWVAAPPGPGTADTFAAISSARASDSTSTIW
jgi:hypothetical protein